MIAYVSFFFFLISTIAYSAPNLHPLDPLTREEISAAIRILKQSAAFPKKSRFSYVALDEPKKSDVLAWKKGDKFIRQAFLSGVNDESHRSFEARVNLSEKKIVALDYPPNAQAMILGGEYDLVEGLIRQDPRWQAAMKKRGITDFNDVAIDEWAMGAEMGSGSRFMRGISFFRGGDTNYYERPIEGVVAIVDVTAKKVVEVNDSGVVPFLRPKKKPKTAMKSPVRKMAEIAHEKNRTPIRKNGWSFAWGNWSFRLAFHPREGLTLYQVTFNDQSTPRSILYRASLSEMVVPYADPSPSWNWRSAFDMGEYGFGVLSSPQAIGNDIPTHAITVNAVFADEEGQPEVVADRVALYERDVGVLWKHYDSEAEKNIVHRARELVVSSSATIGNYDYLMRWVFQEDGTIRSEVGLTGILLAQGTTQATSDLLICPGCHGELIAENIIAPNHQHFFNFRLDFDVDGPNNILVEVNGEKSENDSIKNPGKNAFIMKETLLANETEAQRPCNAASARHWKIKNPNHRSPTGRPSAYTLMPQGNSVPFLDKSSATRKRAYFLENHFWGTRYKEGERFAAGNYVNQSVSDSGLSAYSDKEALENQDITIWYTLGMTHFPRPEEWPIMSAHWTGFTLQPVDFFDRNPSLIQ